MRQLSHLSRVTSDTITARAIAEAAIGYFLGLVSGFILSNRWKIIRRNGENHATDQHKTD